MNTSILYKSNKKNKKYVLDYQGKKRYHFGAKGYADFLLLNDKNSIHYEPIKEKRDKRKKLYISRHSKDPIDTLSPASLSRFILWEKPTLKEGLKIYEKLFNIKILDNTDEVYKK